MKALFQNRMEASAALAERLEKYAGEGTVLLGIDRGGTMLAAELSQRLRAPFDLLPVQGLNLPYHRHMPVGAVAPGGVCVLDDELVDLLDVETDAIGVLRGRAQAELEQQGRWLRGERSLPRVAGRNVILVSDMVASPLQCRAALMYLRRHDASSIVLATPMATPAALRQLQPFANELVALCTPEVAPALDLIYADETSTDREVRRVLGVVNSPPPREVANE